MRSAQKLGPALDRRSSAAYASPARRYTIERVGPDGWNQIEDWDQVVATSARPSVFLTRDWVVCWWRCFGEGLRPWLLRVADRDGSTIGLAPLYMERASGTLPLRVRRLGLIGDREVGSEYLGLIAGAGREAEVGRAVMAQLATAGLTWDVADLFGLVEGDPAGAALEAGMRTHASRVHSERIPCSVIPLPDTFDTYLAGLGSKFRQTYRQRANKLRRSCSVRFFKTESEGELQGHLEALYQMHQARWAAAGYLGSFADARVRRFYLEVSRRLLETGRLRFWHLEVDGVIRASQFGFAFNGVLHSLQEGYDTSFRPAGVGGLGVVLRGHVLRSCIEEGLHAYDFLAGVEDFKTRWGTSTHYVRSVRMVAPGLRGRLAWMATVRAEDVRAMLKELAPDRLVRIRRAARLRRSHAGQPWSKGDTG